MRVFRREGAALPMHTHTERMDFYTGPKQRHAPNTKKEHKTLLFLLF